MHNMSSTCQFVSSTNPVASTFTANVKVPITISTNLNSPLTQDLPNVHWYSCAGLAFRFTGTNVAVADPNNTISIADNSNSLFLNSVLFPNPASKIVNLKLNIANNSPIQIQLINHLGQLVRTIETTGKIGENNIEINLTDVSEGIYMVKIKAGNAVTTKKLIVE